MSIQAAAGGGLAQLVHLLTTPAVGGLVLAVGFAGLLIEMQTLQLVAGLIGATALGIYFGAHVAAGLSDQLVLGLALFGVIAIMAELHLLPGHGVAGAIGLASLVAAVMLSSGVALIFLAVQSLGVAIVVGLLLYVSALRLYPQNAFVQRISFQGVQGSEYVAAPDLQALVGASGFATSYLRPAGVAAIGGRRVDVLTEGEFVAAGAPVVVTRVEGARVFVRAA